MDSVEVEVHRSAHYRTIDGKKYYHKEDGPAVIWNSGDTEYMIKNVYHRLDGPAVNYKNLKIWYVNGIRHRTDGPAYIADDDKRYYYKGKVVDVNNDKDFANFIKFKAFW